MTYLEMESRIIPRDPAIRPGEVRIYRPGKNGVSAPQKGRPFQVLRSGTGHQEEHPDDQLQEVWQKGEG